MAEIAHTEPCSESETTPAYARWLRIMAALYDPFLWFGELAGMRRRRRALVGDAYGVVVEIGSGTGLNVAHYPDGLDRLVLTEPEPGMRHKLSRRLKRLGRTAVVSGASAEHLPAVDGSVDTVVSTLVLCTVADPERVLREIARVLRPDGQLLFIEHVRARSRFLAACQDLLLGPWRGFAGGCECNRATVELMYTCGFTVQASEAVWRGMPAIVHPLVIGRATR